MINEKNLDARVKEVFGAIKDFRVPKYVANIEEASIHISGGNSKLGKTIYNISFLCGNQEHLLVLKDGTLLTDVYGTCSVNCDGCFKVCYARRSAIQHHNVCIPAWMENTILKRNNIAAFYVSVREYIKALGKKCKYFRWNQSGEVESAFDIYFMNVIAIANPDVRFSLYTKNYDALEQFIISCNDNNVEIAKNFTINVSQWKGVADDFLSKYRQYVNVFEYDDSNVDGSVDGATVDSSIEGLKKADHCPAVRFDGGRNEITCDGCLRCYVKSGKKTKCYSH